MNRDTMMKLHLESHHRMLNLTKNILVTGMQGSGKSYLTKQWSLLGVKTADTDTIPELSKWHDEQGKIVPFNINADEAWWNTHVNLWDRDFLQEYLQKNGPIILLGAARNTMETLNYFDNAYYLKVPATIIAQRLQADDRENAFGSTAIQREIVVKKVQESDTSMTHYPITVLDGTLSPEMILANISL